jgi:hypothetical protein
MLNYQRVPMVFVHLDGHRMGPELQRSKARASVVSQGWGCLEHVKNT